MDFCNLSLRIVDGNGEPVSGAAVTVARVETLAGRQSAYEVQGTSDANGDISFTVPRSSNVLLQSTDAPDVDGYHEVKDVESQFLGAFRFVNSGGGSSPSDGMTLSADGTTVTFGGTDWVFTADFYTISSITTIDAPNCVSISGDVEIYDQPIETINLPVLAIIHTEAYLDLVRDGIIDTGLNSLVTVDGTLYLNGNNIVNPGLNAVVSVAGRIDLQGNQIVNPGFDSLVGAIGWIDLSGNQIVNPGLGGITGVTERLDLNNNQIVNADLGGITSITGLVDLSHNQIVDAVFDALASIGADGSLTLDSNVLENVSFASLESIEGSVTTFGNGLIVGSNFPVLTSMAGQLRLGFNHIADPGMPALVSITGASKYLELQSNEIVDPGLAALTTIGAGAQLLLDHNLIVDPGLTSLTTIAGDLTLNNNRMTADSLDTFFNGLADTVTVGGGSINVMTNLGIPSAASDTARAYLEGLGITINI